MTDLDTEDLKELKNFFSAFDEEGFKKSHETLLALVKRLSDELEVKNRDLESKIKEIALLKRQNDNILASISDAVIAVDSTGNFITFNRAAQDVLGCKVLPDHIREVGGAVDENFLPLFQLLQDVLSAPDEGIRARELVVATASKTYTFSASVNAIRDGQDTLVGVVGSFSDRTEIANLQNDLKRRDRLHALGEMAAGVAHEIRNPLGGIGLYADMMDRELSDNDMDPTLAQKISRAVSKLNTLVEDMLTFTRSPRLMPAEHNLNTLIQQAVEIALATVPNNDVAISTDSNLNVRVAVDADQMHQVFLNLIRNAVEAVTGRETAMLRISASAHPNKPNNLSVRFSDTGPGISDEDKDQIFHPFFTKGKKDGTGLGLAIAYKIAESHGGDIELHDNDDGGACFVVNVPLASGQSSAGLKSAQE